MKNVILFVFYLLIVGIAPAQRSTPKIPKKSSGKDSTKLQLKDTVSIQMDTVSKPLQIILNTQQPNKDSNFKDILPFITLILGIAINRGLDYFNNRKRTKRIGLRWLAELNSIEDPIKKQITYLEEFKAEHEKDKFDIPRMQVVISLDGEVFNSLDKSELIKYLETFKKKTYGDSILLSNRINGFITILKSHMINLKQKFDEYQKGISFYTTNLTKSLQDFMKEFTIYGVELEKQLGHDPINEPKYRPILDLVDTQIFPYMSKGDYDVFVLEQKFFNPLMMFFGQHRLDEKIMPMAEALRACVNNVKGIKMEKHYMTQNLQTIIERYKQERSELSDILSEI